jgi:hypothetical protein
MFIIPRRGVAVLATLTITALVTLLTACVQTPVRSADVARRACPAGMVEIYSASGSARNAERRTCQSPSQLEARIGWPGR